MKAITPIIAIIILLLITIAVAGMAWVFVIGYYTGLTAKNIQISDSYVMVDMAGTNWANIVISNIGTENISLGECTYFGGTSVTCGDMTISKTSGGGLDAGFVGEPKVLAKGQPVVLKDVCSGTCTYRIIISSTGARTVTVTAPPKTPG